MTRRIVGYCGMTANFAWCDDGTLWYWPTGGSAWQRVERPPIPETVEPTTRITYNKGTIEVTIPDKDFIPALTGGTDAKAEQQAEGQGGPLARPDTGAGSGTTGKRPRGRPRGSKTRPQTPQENPPARPPGR